MKSESEKGKEKEQGRIDIWSDNGLEYYKTDKKIYISMASRITANHKWNKMEKIIPLLITLKCWKDREELKKFPGENYIIPSKDNKTQSWLLKRTRRRWYEFAMAAITKYHGPSGLNRNLFSQSFEGQKY